MAVSASGEVVGSVSGGCVESAVYEVAREVIETGRPQTHRYGVSDGDAFAVGLTCGGVLDVLVEPVDSVSFAEFGDLAGAIGTATPVATATQLGTGARLIVWPDRVTGGLGDARLDA